MGELWISHDEDFNMHVNPQGMHVEVSSPNVPAELTEADLNAQKAGIRAIVAARLELIWQQCEPFIRNSVGDGLDVRMAKLGLDVLDRVIKVHEVLGPDRATTDDGGDEVWSAKRRQEILDDLQARVSRAREADERLGD